MNKDQYISNLSKHEIKNVSDYISIIKEFIDKHKKNGVTFLYRGEPKYHETFCSPNIFRKNVLHTNAFYEKNLFDAMRQNKLTNSFSYLENAIDAQHGEFPSRLLDVSYNCLSALYFAVTPYYHKSVDSLDKEDGMVFIFYINDIFSPSAKNINDNYNAIINNNQEWFSNNVIFQKNHKFIDHTKINNRIIAQQGAFILFQGNDAEKMPAYMMNGIYIPASSKPIIREELSLMFGINTGSIYPEIVNLAEDIVQKSKRLVAEDFNLENEIKYVFKNLKYELDYYTAYLLELENKYSTEFFEAIQMIEITINSYRIGLIDLNNNLLNKNENISKAIADYNLIINEFIDNIDERLNIEISNDLLIKIEEGI